MITLTLAMPPALPQTLVLPGHRGHRPGSMATASVSCAPPSPLAGPAQKSVLATHHSSRSFLICTGARWQGACWRDTGGWKPAGPCKLPGPQFPLQRPDPLVSPWSPWQLTVVKHKALVRTHCLPLKKTKSSRVKLPQERVHKGSPHSMYELTFKTRENYVNIRIISSLRKTQDRCSQMSARSGEQGWVTLGTLSGHTISLVKVCWPLKAFGGVTSGRPGQKHVSWGPKATQLGHIWRKKKYKTTDAKLNVKEIFILNEIRNYIKL